VVTLALLAAIAMFTVVIVRAVKRWFGRLRREVTEGAEGTGNR
jgi:hypothetical protein